MKLLQSTLIIIFLLTVYFTDNSLLSIVLLVFLVILICIPPNLNFTKPIFNYMVKLEKRIFKKVTFIKIKTIFYTLTILIVLLGIFNILKRVL